MNMQAPADVLNNPQVLQQLRAILSMDITTEQIAQALRKWSWSILPYPETFPVFHITAAGTPQDQKIQIDGSYALLVYAISVIETGDNKDSLINSVNVNTLTNMIGSNPLPTGMITKFTGVPVPWFMAVPPNATVSTQIQTGSTGAADFYVTFWALRVPADIIEGIKQQFAIR